MPLVGLSKDLIGSRICWRGDVTDMTKRQSLCLIAATMCAVSCLSAGESAETPLTTIRVANGLRFPLFVTHAAGDFDRVFILEQEGKIQILKDGVILGTPYLDISSLTELDGELGLLGLAFHPDFQENGYFYVNYTKPLPVSRSDAPDTVIARYQVSSNPDLADGGSAQIVMTFPQPYKNHNSGWLGFGPDGLLYIASGDGGDQYDPDNNAQTLIDNPYGKMLRIDVDQDGFPADPLRNYAIPPGNPFRDTSADDETWAYGLRNPWRCAFDRATGELYIADVGQFAFEEINLQAADSTGGENYGWKCMEGLSCTGRAGCTCDSPSLTLPVLQYSHANSRCSITGGEVYRGCAIPDLAGAYFFADFCTNEIWSMRMQDGEATVVDRTAELSPANPLNITTISSFGLDAFGEMYLCDWSGGEVFKIVPDQAPVATRLIGSDPPDGSVDARQPFSPDGSNPTDRWQTIDLFLAGCADAIQMGDITVTESGAGGNEPVVDAMTIVGPSQIRAHLSRPVSRGVWTILTHELSGSSIRLGVLSADVNADGTSGVEDVTAWIAAQSGFAPVWSSDIDASGSSTPADILRLIDLLSGAATYAVYDGQSLP